MIAVLESPVTAYSEGTGSLKNRCCGNVLLRLRDSPHCCAATDSVAVCPGCCGTLLQP